MAQIARHRRRGELSQRSPQAFRREWERAVRLVVRRDRSILEALAASDREAGAARRRG